jgi:TorA maturation chaperone TorD
MVFLEDRTLERLSSQLARICPGAEPFAVAMKKALLASHQEDLLVEYSRLFVGPAELKAPPYGSVYLEKGRHVMGVSTMEVASQYRTLGLTIDDDFEELPDHIAVELEYMYYLSFRAVEALRRGEPDKARYYTDAQENFSERFMRPWVTDFCNTITEGTDSLYYQSLARCLSAVMESTDDNISVPSDVRHLQRQV